MKFSLTLTCLFFLFQLYANTLEVVVYAGFCDSAENGQARAKVSGGTEPYTFQWSMSNENSDFANDLTPGDNSLTVTDATGCETVEDFYIHEQSQVFIDMFIIDPSCYGDEDGKLFFDTYPPYELEFSLDGINFTEDEGFENLAPGDYILYVLETNGCITEWSFFVQEPLPILVDFGPDVEIRLGDSIQLEPIVNSPAFQLSFHWITDTPIPCDWCSENYVKPFETTTIQLLVTDENGCTASDEITVFVRDERNIFIPNVFTPNGDGFNDILTVYAGQAVTQIKRFVIRDNFGGLVHEAINFQPNIQSFGWDGRMLGKALQRNVFIYMVVVEYVDGTIEEIFGTVTLLK